MKLKKSLRFKAIQQLEEEREREFEQEVYKTEEVKPILTIESNEPRKKIRKVHVKYCMGCKKTLRSDNQIGICRDCLNNDPKYREMKRLLQNKYYKKPMYIKKRKEYVEQNKKKIYAYQKQYVKDHIEKIREQKREWAKKKRQMRK